MNATLIELIKDRIKELYGESNDSNFNMFAANSILRKHNLSYEELEDGIVDGSEDLGIDAVYIFVNGVHITSEEDIPGIKTDMALDIYFIQSKSQSKFHDTVILKFINSVDKCLSLDEDKVNSIKNELLRNKIELLKQTATKTISARNYTIRVKYRYAYMGRPIDDKNEEIEKLHTAVKDAMPKYEPSFKCLGAQELYDASKGKPDNNKELPISKYFEHNTCYVVLAKLSDYYNFITENGVLDEQIFEGNVRHYLGANREANKGINNTLENRDLKEEFWWLNNGVTMLCSGVSVSSDKANIKNPEIVNGMQTSSEIYRFFSEEPQENLSCKTAEKSILIRIIEMPEEEEDGRVAIIKATNTQSQVDTSTMYTLEPIHIQIEDFFKKHDLFYERKQCYYKNQDKPRNKIVSFNELAQAVTAVWLQQPHQSRMRVSTILNQAETRQKIYRDGIELKLHLNCIKIVKLADDFLKNQNIPKTAKTNARFHICMIAPCLALNKAHMAEKDLQDLTKNQLEEISKKMKDALEVHNQALEDLKELDNAPKSSKLTEKELEIIRKRVSSG